MLFGGIVVGILGIVGITVWQVRKHPGRFRYRPSFEAACEITVGDRTLLAYSGHRRTIRLADPAEREDVSVLQDSRTWIRALCEVHVDGTSLLASGGRDGTCLLYTSDAADE